MIQDFNPATAKRAAHDYDGNGRSNQTVFRPSGGNWYLLNSTAGFSSVQFGAAEGMTAPAALIP